MSGPGHRSFFSCHFGKLLALGLLSALVIAISLLSVMLGTVRIPVPIILDAVMRFDGSRDHLLVMAIRAPRAIAALLAGSALAVSGAITQAVTGNPLASPGLLGINAGAAFAVVSIMTFSGAGVGDTYIWFAFAGAGTSAVIVLLLGSASSGMHANLALVLSGAMIATFLTSLTSAILIFDQSTLDAVRMWTAGSLSGKTMSQTAIVAPYILTGLVIALFLGRHLTMMSLGTDTALALGLNPLIWRGVSILNVILLAGGAVALAGPIGFVGLVVPHIVRMTISFDYRWVIPFSALGGALLVIGSDTMGRIFMGSPNFPVGVTIAFAGAPFFLWLARTRMRSET